MRHVTFDFKFELYQKSVKTVFEHEKNREIVESHRKTFRFEIYCIETNVSKLLDILEQIA